ncbi:uncharacterized protein LOC131842848 [Achroia grisella]|uniref:uncharacterized protein LOC131842848 n=1 Tax=Achroia grisella TaxID=688607 RepID=UPI0027D3217F|nr:uncharacterized protein LOC131842848 [Achroia grisella]
MMKYNIVLVIVSFELLYGCWAEFVQNGQCEDINGVVWTLEDISGEWELHRQLGADIKDCPTIEVEEQSGNTATILSRAVQNNFNVEENGIVTPQDNNYATIQWDNANEDLEVLVLNVISMFFLLVVTCKTIDESTRAVNIWQYQRLNMTLQGPALSAINHTLQTQLQLTIDDLDLVDHSDYACYRLPEILPGQPIILPFKCNENTPVVSNFDIERFLGPWHEIASYYSEHVIGTCARTEYTIVDGVVNVLNNYVINQALGTTPGNASVIGDNNSGKLNVFLEISPEEYLEREIWILDTDYDYAILYSCDNLPDDQSRVYSWILSRSSTLSVASQEAVDRHINSQLDLNNVYYQDTPRNDDDCFYYPEPNPGEPVVFRGRCGDVPVMANFDSSKFYGLWHNIESYAANFQTGTCSNVHYTAGPGGEIGIFNTQVINQTLDSINGIASVPDPDEPAKFNLTLPVDNGVISVDYWILDTDYDAYALVYSCINIEDNQRYVFSWKLSKTKSLSEESQERINNTVNEISVLDQQYYEPVNQSAEGCFYFPVPVPDQPVVFPGQCDENINVPILDLSRFTGIWYEVEAYPTNLRPGTCINHEYTTGTGNSLNLQSGHVDDRTLHIANATVTADQENSGRLTISIPNDEGGIITVPFWVISTDYDDYAVIYSCINLNEDYRSVFSWKLSRTKQLSSQGNTAIDNAISNIVVLRNDYYERIDQSDEACFYLPHLEAGEPIILPGQCDPNVQVVQDFNTADFLDRWYLIESYHSDLQTGTCNDASYRLLPNGDIQIYNTQVIDETLNTVIGTVIPIANGKLRVEYEGVADPIEYWVLDTDYTSYALIYSCVNINTDTRRVWSWKLGRDRYLSDDSIASINRTMEGVNVLHYRYFHSISHTSDDCFYFPEITGEPVFYRGQCDETISVVANFDPVLYAGRWYSIQSYPIEFQYGTCLSTEHTLDQASGSYDLYYSQIHLQRQNIMNATAAIDSDGTGKLNVSFPLPGYIYPAVDVVIPYWILDTDYDNYALVYSCDNFNNEYMRVGYWRLSRNKTLSPESIAAIESVTNNLKILDDRYLITWGHDDENDDCFFYPELTDGQVIQEGQCADNDITVVSGFDPNQFKGVWHELERYPSKIQIGECLESDFILNTTNSFNVIQNLVRNERLKTYTGQALVASNGSGVITVELRDETEEEIINLNLYVLDTDYTEFALLYSCENINQEQKQVFSWKLGRHQSELSPQAKARIDEAVTNNRNLWAGYYEDAGQNNDACFYYPRFNELPDYITFRGPCDERIRGISNFDVNRYAGRWIEIEKYPQPFQFGTCHRSEYDVVNGILEVHSTQVSNRTLLSLLGSATVSSDDGSGMLSVTFLIDGVETVANYYILATDYDSYSLVYTCSNIPDGRRQVHSWKLSRTFSLSQQANNIIDQTILDTQGLIEEYYTPTSQDEEDCFYVPEVDPERAPVFRGQCQDIVGQENFNIQQFLGWWHEIKSYPRDGGGGECTSSRYQSSDGQFQLVDTGIFDVTAQITTGTVQANSNGRLTRTLSNGQQQEIWVLTTDYENYAFLYSCENIDNEHRRVWSALHSRNRTVELPAEVQTAIEEFIEENEVLYPKFYLDVDQSDNACFHYPEQSGQQIILPGQCDENIPVQQNFEIEEYTGRWYQTERYPHENERGTCIGTEYNLDIETGILTVLNWAVIDDELITVEGNVTITTDDGSAKLIMELLDADTNETTTLELYVLTTDYANYSLLYSCTNIDEYNRAVGAWKLSRTRVMSPESTEAVNAYMSTREELHQPYFIDIVQYEDCDEPDSSILIQSSSIMLIVCLAIQILSFV